MRLTARSGSQFHLRRTLFTKYFAILFVAVALPLLITGISDAWLGYLDQRSIVAKLLKAEAISEAQKIQSFLGRIKDALDWTVQQPWADASEERHQLDVLRVMRQAPAIVDIALLDDTGIERLYVSRVGLNRMRSGVDRSTDPAVSGARFEHIWYGPVTYFRGSEPFITVSVAGNRSAVGFAVAHVNLKLIWEVINDIHIGRTGRAFVLDQEGQLIAHTDISRVLRGADKGKQPPLHRVRDQIEGAGGPVATLDDDGVTYIADMATIPDINWVLVIEQPLSEAFQPIYAAIRRTVGGLLVGVGFAGALAYWLARRMVGPIRLLEEGTQRIASGQFDYRIQITTRDELEHLAASFNGMAKELAISQERSERINRLKQFLAPQVAELVEMADETSVLAGRLAKVVVLFCDLRGFTAFCNRAEPAEIIELLREYYAALGLVVTEREATLMHFSGDGIMVLVNAPIPCPEPALKAVEIAVHMQQVVQHVIVRWHSRGYTVGFGIGLAMGWATVGQIGYESRSEYTANGNVVNLAARLCSVAEDGQILVDSEVADAVHSEVGLMKVGTRNLKGYDEEVPVYLLECRQARQT